MKDSLTRLGLVAGLVVAGSVAPAAAQAKPTAHPAAVTDESIAKGKEIFTKGGLCYACHGSEAKGAVGPNLTDGEWLHSDGSYEAIVATVTSGVPKEKSKSGIVMPPKGGSSISEDDVKLVAAYVWSLSHP